MKRDGQRWGWQFWMVLGVGAWLGAGLGAVKTAEATELVSGLLKSETGETHCAVVNLGTSEIRVRVAIRNGDGGDTCNDAVHNLDPGEAGGVLCDSTEGAYCVVTGTFQAKNVRAKFTSRDSAGTDVGALPVTEHK